LLARAFVAAIAYVLSAAQAIALDLSAAPSGVKEGGNAVHDGIFKSNLTVGKRRENNSVAFGKVAVGNALFRECTFSWIDAHQSCKEAGKLDNGEGLRWGLGKSRE